MKRVIKVRTKHVSIVATITKGSEPLTGDEMDVIRDEMADDLMKLAAGLRWFRAPLHSVKVS